MPALPAEPTEEFVTAGPRGEVPAGHSLYLPEPEPAASGSDEARYRLQLAVGARPGGEDGAAAAPASPAAAAARIPTGRMRRFLPATG